MTQNVIEHSRDLKKNKIHSKYYGTHQHEMFRGNCQPKRTYCRA